MENTGSPKLIIWLTGISGSGKSSIASELTKYFEPCTWLDGDTLRQTVNSDLGFTKAGRLEAARRAVQLALKSAQTGVTICSLITPYRESRDAARALAHREGVRFAEVYVRCSIETAAQRDPKGLYARHKAGYMTGLTGVDDPYEPPVDPVITVDTEKLSIQESVYQIRHTLDQT